MNSTLYVGIAEGVALRVYDISDGNIGSDDAEGERESQGNILGVGRVTERIAELSDRARDVGEAAGISSLPLGPDAVKVGVVKIEEGICEAI